MRVAFLDRDGVINRYPGDRDYVKDLSEFHFLPGAKEALKKLTDSGVKICVISNQAGVSRGVYPLDKLNLITQKMLDELKAADIDISGVYYCTHKPEDDCLCRKPRIGLITRAMDKLKRDGVQIDLAQSYFVGDTIKDVQAGKAAGLNTILVFSGKETLQNKDNWEIIPDFTAPGLLEAANIIIRND